MNIFVTDDSPVISAYNLDDKRVKHMPKESIEMLACYIHYVTGKWVVPFPLWGDATRLSKESKIKLYNHGCTLWVKKDKANAWWLYEHLLALIAENEYRFGEVPSIVVYLPAIEAFLSDPGCRPRSFRNSSLYKDTDVVSGYRLTMLSKWNVTDKIKPVIWTKRGAPRWYNPPQQTTLQL